MTVPDTTEPVTEAAVETAETPAPTTEPAAETTVQPGKVPHKASSKMAVSNLNEGSLGIARANFASMGMGKIGPSASRQIGNKRKGPRKPQSRDPRYSTPVVCSTRWTLRVWACRTPAGFFCDPLDAHAASGAGAILTQPAGKRSSSTIRIKASTT